MDDSKSILDVGETIRDSGVVRIDYDGLRREIIFTNQIKNVRSLFRALFYASSTSPAQSHARVDVWSFHKSEWSVVSRRFGQEIGKSEDYQKGFGEPDLQQLSGVTDTILLELYLEAEKGLSYIY